MHAMNGARWLGMSLAVWGLLGLTAVFPARAIAAPVESGGLRLEVQELAESIDLARGKERFLTVTVEITGVAPGPLRRVQPLREDFQLLAGKVTLPCRWLRGGTVPDDASRLRFTLGFTPPPRGTRRVSLRANLPQFEGDQALEVALSNLPLGAGAQERSGKGWRLSIGGLEVRDYVPPELPVKGQFTIKSIPADTRVFRKAAPGATPDRAVQLSFSTADAELYDPTLDVSGWLTVDGGAQAPLLSAMMRRFPSRSTEAKIPPHVTGQFYFALPPRGKVTGVVLRFHRRPETPEMKSVTVPNLPVPGS